MDTLQMLSARIEESAKRVTATVSDAGRRKLLNVLYETGYCGNEVTELLNKIDKNFQIDMESSVREAMVNVIVGIGERIVSRRLRNR